MRLAFRPVFCFFALLLFLAAPLRAEITVSEMEGSAQIQMEGERRWRAMKGDEVINDNDVIKTGYKSKISLRAERINQIVIGSNSKVLINVSRSKRSLPVVSVTLFEGAILSKIISNVEFTVYTTTASATTQGSVLSAVVEEKTGRSGFQVLSGNVVAQNLIIKGEAKLTPGSTSVIEANRPPSSPNPLTTTHVSILGRFFGNKYIDAQIKETGARPVKAVHAADTRIKASATLGKAPYKRANAKEAPALESPFDLNFVVERIAEKEAVQNRIYTRPSEPGQVFVLERVVGGDFRTVIFNGRSYPFFGVRTGLRWRALQLVMGFPFVPSITGQMGAGEWNTPDAILEKFSKLQIAPSRMPFYVVMGALEPLTLGYGLAVEDFSYRLPRAAVQKTGIKAALTLTDWTFGIVVPNITGGDVLIPHFQYDDGLFSLLFAYIMDTDQTRGLHAGDIAFLNRSLDTPADTTLRPISQYDIEATWNIYYHPPVWLQMYAGFSQIRSAERGNIGYGVIAPGFSLYLRQWKLMAEIRSHTDSFISPYYNPFWAEDRARFMADSSIVTLEDRLIDNHAAKGVKFLVERSFLKGSTMAISHFRNLTAFDSTNRFRPRTDANTRFLLRLSDEALPSVKSLSLYFDRYHEGYFEETFSGPASQSRAGLQLQTLLATYEVDLDAKTYFLDTDGQYTVSSLGRVWDVTLSFGKHF